MEEDLEELQLVVEIFDLQGNYVGEWAYDVSRSSIQQWEEADRLDFEHGKCLVRYLILTRLKEHSFITWQLLTNNTCLGEFLSNGVPNSIVEEIPRLSILNTAVDRMYDCLCRLVVAEDIRIAH